ncbi:MAG: hypothetical protein HY905_28095 [Deltaproteobacteria bacterium]|nr:hypothetical protein [Deltaproteobacteria bacterium]
MASKCHVCGKLTRKPIQVPVCGDPATKIPVCSKRCRDEYLAGYVETHKGKSLRMLQRPHGPGVVLAILWAGYGLVHLVGPVLARAVPVPLLPARMGPEFYTGGFAALIVAFAVLREAKQARLFSTGLAAVGILFAVLSYAKTRHPSYVLEAATVFPAALLLALGEPGPKRVLGALGLFALYPVALIVTAATGMFTTSRAAEQVAAESYDGPVHVDPRARLRLSVPDGWYILREESTLLPHDGALFRALRPEGRISVHVYDRPDCRPAEPTRMVRVLDAFTAAGAKPELDQGLAMLPVSSPLGEGRSFFVRVDQPRPQLWYLVFLPWTEGRCLELRCGGAAGEEPAIRRDCIPLGARGLAPTPPGG